MEILAGGKLGVLSLSKGAQLAFGEDLFLPFRTDWLP